ncbi:MAG: ribosome maturation factor RimP [Bryobacteraceae bacterium]
MTSPLIARIEQIAGRVARSEGLEVVDVELKGGGSSRFLRISIDKPTGVTHADCELVSQQVGTILDVEDVVPGRYTLEVSSPGVERKLRGLQDFERFRGRKVKVVLREALEGQKRLEGILAGVEGGEIALEAAPGRVVRFSLEQVDKANLKFEWGRQG